MRVGLPRASVLERFSSKDGLAADRKEAACLMDAMNERENFRTGPRIPDIRIRTELPSNQSKHSPCLINMLVVFLSTTILSQLLHMHTSYAADALSSIHSVATC